MSNLLPPKDVSWKGPAMPTEIRPACLSTRLSVNFDAVHLCTFDSEQCIHGLLVLLNYAPAIRVVSRVISRLECHRTRWNSVISRQSAPTQTMRDPNRDETLARSNQPRTSKLVSAKTAFSGTNYSSYCQKCRQYFRICLNYKLLYREDCLMCCSSNKVVKSDS